MTPLSKMFNRVLACTLCCSLLTPMGGFAADYIAFGDSITEGTGDDEPVRGYPARLETLLRNAGRDDTVRNEGVGGEKTPEGLSRLGSVLNGGGDVLLLMEGSNDISVQISRETTLFNLKKMAEKAENDGVEVVHASMIPRSPNSRIDVENHLNQRLIEEIRHEAGVHQRQVVDNFEVISSTPNWFEDLYWKQPTDYVGHPNSAGYDLMAASFFDVLTGSDNIPPVTGIISPFNGATNVKAASAISVEIWDFGAGIDTSSVVLLVDGQSVEAELTGGQRRGQLRYQPAGPLRGVVTVSLRATDLDSPANSVNREISTFVIAGTTFIEGDIDKDGRVDGVDLVILARAFGTSKGEARFEIGADFDENGSIDGGDLAVLATNFGQAL